MNNQNIPTILLLSRQRMFRDLFSYYLGNIATDFGVIQTSSLDLLSDSERAAVSLVALIDMTCDNHSLMESIRGVRAAMPDIPLAVISDCEDRDVVLSALRLGIKGYISTSMGDAALTHALRILLVGGEFIPSAPLLANGSANGVKMNDLTMVAGNDGQNLSRREREVLALLCRGKPNKVIAADLDMQEGTVKVHMRNIMRKLRAHNRLEVVLATNNLLLRDGDRMRANNDVMPAPAGLHR